MDKPKKQSGKDSIHHHQENTYASGLGVDSTKIFGKKVADHCGFCNIGERGKQHYTTLHHLIPLLEQEIKLLQRKIKLIKSLNDAPIPLETYKSYYQLSPASEREWMAALLRNATRTFNSYRASNNARFECINPTKNALKRRNAEMRSNVAKLNKIGMLYPALDDLIKGLEETFNKLPKTENSSKS